MIIDHSNCAHGPFAVSRAECREKRDRLRGAIAELIEDFGMGAWRGLDPNAVAEFMMSSVDALAQFKRIQLKEEGTISGN